MAANIPAPLKTADIQRFAIRAAQVEKAKPAAAYWCNYYVLDKILDQGLHKTNDDCSAYVVSLMDKVEQMKSDHADDDAMKDDLAGKAYMEQFGLETFMRADNAIRANKATKQTADTLQAAWTFLDVLNVWPPVDPEITAKIKFAKYHAVRIAKAIKAGEDPNLSNPTPEPEEAPPPPLDADDPEVQAIAGLGPASSVVGGQDDGQLGGPGGGVPEIPQFVDRPPVSPTDGPISLPPYPNEHSAPSTQAMPRHHRDAESFYQGAAGSHPDVSPLPASDNGGGYFPPPSEGAPSPLTSHPPTLPGPPSAPPRSPQNPVNTSSPMHMNAAQPPPPFPGALGQSHASSQQPQPPPPVAYRAPVPSAAPAATSPVQPYSQPAVEVDDAAMTSAQKHARFAISALNFEDVPTAVKELRAALADLGAL